MQFLQFETLILGSRYLLSMSKGCLPQILPGLFLSTLTQMTMKIDMIDVEKRIHIEKVRVALVTLIWRPQCF